MKTNISTYFCDDNGERFFGRGPYDLLRGIEEHGSLRASAQSMGLGYTKAFKLIKRAEECFGFALTTRQIGGSLGGGSRLTPKAKELLMRYEAYYEGCREMAQNLFNIHFATFNTGEDK